MRPRQSSLGIKAVPIRSRSATRFNEAEAIKPRNLASNCPCRITPQARFNEAEAIKPRNQVRLGLARCLPIFSASMRPRQSSLGIAAAIALTFVLEVRPLQ